ncbi:latent transforming growth factor beta binding like protein [Cryptosporidium ryanae]|uniref:latent transforming growth factor beta binding like protein n=1 Tax=Cryptosporidium ryanae TaxID=515981 RepID=UPI003519FD7B|nr:latent transforming growth factor beta binding like protein [Cryptosporidium ryanae]
MFGIIKLNYLFSIGLILFSLTYSSANESELSNEAWVTPNANQNHVYDSTSDEGMSILNRKIVETQSNHKHKNKQQHHHHHNHKHQHNENKEQNQHQNKNHNYVDNIIHRNQTNNNNSYLKTYTPDYSDSTDNEIYYVFDNNLNSKTDNYHYFHYDTRNNDVYQMKWERSKHHHLFNYTTTTTTIPIISTTQTTTMRPTTTTSTAVAIIPTNSTTTTRPTTTTSTASAIIQTNNTTTTTKAIPNNNKTTTSTTTKAASNNKTTTTTTTKVISINNSTSTTTKGTLSNNATTTTTITTTDTNTSTTTINVTTTTSTISTSTSTEVTYENNNEHKYAVSLVMDLSKVPNIDQMKEINISANIIYRKLINSGLTAELVSISSNSTDYIHEKTNFLSTIQRYENNIKVDRLLSSVVENRRIIEDENNINIDNSNLNSNKKGRGLNNHKTIVQRKKIVYITAGYNGCTSEKNCPGILKLKESADIYMISLSKNPIMYNEIEYISTEPVHLYSVLMTKKELKDEAIHLSKWIRDEYRFNNQKYLLPKKLDKDFKNQVCIKCSENANCYVHSAFEHTRDLSKFECVCSSGWIGDGINCNDINECITLNNPCGNNHCCINTLGGFECKHKEGKC